MRAKNLILETDEVINKKRRLKIELDYTQIYDNIFEAIKGLNGTCSTKLFFWLLRNLNKKNGFPWHSGMIKEFNLDLDKPYNERVVRNALKELTDNKIVIKHGNNHYTMNALYTWKDTTKKRLSYLRAIGTYSPELLQEPEVSYSYEG